MDRPKSSYIQIRIFERLKEDEKIQLNVCVKYKLDEFFYVRDVMNLDMKKLIILNAFVSSSIK